jgi:hypothetical protein
MQHDRKNIKQITSRNKRCPSSKAKVGIRAGGRSARAANPPARLPEDMAPHDTQTTAAVVGALLGIDAATVMEEVGLSGREADDWFDDVL